MFGFLSRKDATVATDSTPAVTPRVPVEAIAHDHDMLIIKSPAELAFEEKVAEKIRAIDASVRLEALNHPDVLDAVQKEKEKLQRIDAERQKNVAALGQEREKLLEQFTKMALTLEREKSLVTVMTKEKTDAVENSRQLELKMSEQVKKLLDVYRSLGAKEKEHAEVDAKNKQLTRELSGTQEQLATNRNKMLILSKENDDVVRKNKQLELKISDYSKKLNDAQASIVHLNEVMHQTLNENGKLDRRVKDLERKAKDVESERKRAVNYAPYPGNAGSFFSPSASMYTGSSLSAPRGAASNSQPRR